MLVDPLPGGKIPDDLKIEIGIQPESGRLPEVVYAATRENNRGQVEYKALTEFDRDEFWRVRLVLQSVSGQRRDAVESGSHASGLRTMGSSVVPFTVSCGRVFVVSRNDAHT